MNRFASLLAGFLLIHGAQPALTTQNCGNAVCRREEDKSCTQLVTDYSFTGTCCSLADTEDGTCIVSVSSGVCFYTPIAGIPGEDGVFLGSGNTDSCEESEYDVILDTISSDVPSDAPSLVPSDAPSLVPSGAPSLVPPTETPGTPNETPSTAPSLVIIEPSKTEPPTSAGAHTPLMTLTVSVTMLFFAFVSY